MAATPPLPCPACGALVAPGETIRHSDWHISTSTAPGWTVRGFAGAFTDAYDATPGDEAPTQKLPPIGGTIRRRPPVPPAVRELKGSELLRALADELDADDDVNADEL